jgi:hypothetical protein
MKKEDEDIEISMAEKKNMKKNERILPHQHAHTTHALRHARMKRKRDHCATSRPSIGSTCWCRWAPCARRLCVLTSAFAACANHLTWHSRLRSWCGKSLRIIINAHTHRAARVIEQGLLAWVRRSKTLFCCFARNIVSGAPA